MNKQFDKPLLSKIFKFSFTRTLINDCLEEAFYYSFEEWLRQIHSEDIDLWNLARIYRLEIRRLVCQLGYDFDFGSDFDNTVYIKRCLIALKLLDDKFIDKSS